MPCVATELPALAISIGPCSCGASGAGNASSGYQGPENRDLRQLLWHRHRLVQMRTRIMNQLQALAMNEGYRWKKKLFSEQGRAQLEKLLQFTIPHFPPTRLS